MRACPNIENCLFIGVLILFIALLIVEKRRPFAKTPSSRLRESFSTNTSAFFFNNVIMSLLSVSSLLLVAENYAGYGLLAGMSDGPLKWLASFVLFDFAVYLWHYLGHQNEFLWRFHKVHHSDKSFNVSTGLRFHVADQLMEVGFKCLCTIVIGVPAKVVVICEIVRMAFVLFHHANVEFAWDKALSWVFITLRGWLTMISSFVWSQSEPEAPRAPAPAAARRGGLSQVSRGLADKLWESRILHRRIRRPSD